MITLPPKLKKTFEESCKKIKSGELRTFIPFLSLFKVNGKPMTLENHFQFAPMFNTVQANKTVWMFGRQLGKSYSLSASCTLRSMLIPGYHQIIAQPRADQIQRLNNTVLQPLMRSCPVMPAFIPNTETNKFALKTFNNGSLTYLEYMLISADRVRGCSGLAHCILDEAQDIEYEFIPIVEQTMSASINWGFSTYTGTPKTTDTTLSLLWQRSSQAEWVIRCDSCGYFNVPNPEHDQLKMIGKHGPICAKCGKPVIIHHGGYVHAYPDRIASFSGFHVSQLTHPLHSINDRKWNNILECVDSYNDVALYNEVFGWPYDSATSPLTLTDLINAEFDVTDNYGSILDITSPEQIQQIRNQYSYITVAVDWSGGGAISDSYTALAVLGLRPDGQVIDVLYGERFRKGLTPTEEADRIMSWIRGSAANAFAYDDGGAGFVRLETMKHAGLMETSGLIVTPIKYVAPRSGDVMRPTTGQREPDMYFYSLDKSRSLAMCIAAIKMKRIRFRRFKHDDESEYVRDFLALREDPRQTRSSETVIIIIKKPNVPDDFAHAVNFGCSQIWDHFGAYPAIGRRYDASLFNYTEEHKHILDDDIFGPRGDFERFQDACNMNAAVILPDENDYF